MKGALWRSNSRIRFHPACLEGEITLHGFRLSLLAAGLACFVPGSAVAEDKTSKEPIALRQLIDEAVNEMRVFSGAGTKEPAKPLVGRA